MVDGGSVRVALRRLSGPFMCRRFHLTCDSPAQFQQHPAPLQKPTQPPSSALSHLHQLVFYSFTVIYWALSGCACTCTGPSCCSLITWPAADAEREMEELLTIPVKHSDTVSTMERIVYNTKRKQGGYCDICIKQKALLSVLTWPVDSVGETECPNEIASIVGRGERHRA